MAALTAEETELYDRQIRAWGFEAQKRMRESKILVVGLDGAGSENLKNLVLAGLGNITILENRKVNKSLIETHFYLQPTHLNQYFADVALTYFSEMNPMIKLTKDIADPYSKSDDFYKSFDVVIVSNHSRYLQLRINDICHQSNIGFFSCRSIGSFGYIFSDLQQHQYQIDMKGNNNNEDEKDNETETKKIESLQWYSLQSALSISGKSLKKQLRKRQNFQSLFYSLQICEQIEDKILEMNKYFIAKDEEDISRDAQIMEAMKSVRDEKSSYFKVFKEIEGMVNKSEQFKGNNMQSDKILNDLLSVWNLSVCPSNAMLGGYLANYVMFYVQRKQKPLHNFLFFDMWSCEALEVLMRSEKEEELAKKVKNDSTVDLNGDTSKKKSNDESVDLSKLSVNKAARKNEVVLLDDSDDDIDEDGDIDLTK